MSLLFYFFLLGEMIDKSLHQKKNIAKNTTATSTFEVFNFTQNLK